jgi:hypothetical protein
MFTLARLGIPLVPHHPTLHIGIGRTVITGFKADIQAFGVPRGAAILFLFFAIPTGRFRHS